MNIQDYIQEERLYSKDRLEWFGSAVISGFATLIFPEYLKNMKEKQVPVHVIRIPEIQAVAELLDSDHQFMKWISENLVRKISERSCIQERISFEELCKNRNLAYFKESNLEYTNGILNTVVIPNLQQTLPKIISKKFQLHEETQQTFREDRTLDLFHRDPVKDEIFDFLVSEIVIFMMLGLEGIERETRTPDNNARIRMFNDEVLTIDHENAICPIHITSNMITKNPNIIDTVGFVTSSSFCTEVPFSTLPRWEVNTHPSNKTTVTDIPDVNFLR